VRKQRSKVLYEKRRGVVITPFFRICAYAEWGIGMGENAFLQMPSKKVSLCEKKKNSPLVGFFVDNE
jgi:hypothetical protein